MRSLSQNSTIARLPNGLRVAWYRVPQCAVEYCGILVRAGSRDDGPDSFGLAHFVEHTIFKGTRRRSSWHILNRMERIGGELNAYTTKEETVIYTAAPVGNLSRAFDLLSDLVHNSRFPQSELDKERDVVADEINSYLDTPSEAVYDDFEELIFAGTPLAHNILGNIKALNTFNSKECQEYLKRWYTPDNMTLFYCGSSSLERVMRMAERYFNELEHHSVDHISVDSSQLLLNTFSIDKNINSHQAHTVMGSVIGGMYSADRYPMALLTNILGGPGMNSLLNLALRERHGYVYSVEASRSLYTDCGLFTIYFGCDPSDRKRCEELISVEIQKILNGEISQRALAAAKKQYIGQLTVASDNRENLAINIGRAANYYDRLLSVEERDALINEISISDLSKAAESISNMSRLTLQ